jgi:hypothetical protein
MGLISKAYVLGELIGLKNHLLSILPADHFLVGKFHAKPLLFITEISNFDL